MQQDIRKKLFNLIDTYTQQDIMVAYSGGADSALLLNLIAKESLKKGRRVYAVTMETMLHPHHEIKEAQETALKTGAKHVVLTVDELSEAGILNNPVDRCYLCKLCLFGKMKKLAQELEISVIVEGTNADDLQAYRPGLKAVKELGVLSPLAEAGLSKKMVRELAEEYGIPAAAKPSAPCMATRFPYGTMLESKEMNKVDKGERFIKALGFYNVRIRVHGNLARIEADRQELANIWSHQDKIITCLKQLGYTYIALDMEGFRSGSMDEEEIH